MGEKLIEHKEDNMNFNCPVELECPFCSNSDFEKAIKTVRNCYIPSPKNGMVKGFFAPGGEYGADWWSLDYSLVVDGAKWIDFSSAVDLIDNLCAVQCGDGRIKLYGTDGFAHVPNVKEPIASLPRYFDTCFEIARMSPDKSLRKKTLDLFTKSLDWWFANRQDPKTALISAVFEETFIPNTVSGSMVYAPIDTNIQIARACRNTSILAEMCGCDSSFTEFYFKQEKSILDAVKDFLWDKENGCYKPYVLTQNRRYDILSASTFLGFSVEGKQRHEKLLMLLKDDSHFNWNTRPLSSVSKKDALFTTVHGRYNGNPAWSGSVWSLHNVAAIKSLKEAGYRREAVRLCERTICTFAGNYAEFIDPFTGSGEGVQEYGWSAAQFLQLVIEFVFGISYSPERGVLSDPVIPEEYSMCDMCLHGLNLPDGRTCSVRIHSGKAEITYDI